MEARYRLNAPEVVSETLDGEALIVHLGTGSYYSCRGSGEAAWAQILSGRTVSEASAALGAHFGVDSGALRADIERFAAELEAEGLVVESGASEASAAPELGAATPYAPPSLEKYTDMQELLALDPVHDIDAEQGWPRVPDAEAETVP